MNLVRDVRRWWLARAGVERPAPNDRPATVVRVAGVIDSVERSGAAQAPLLTARVFTADDVVCLVWLGRRVIAGIEPGRRVSASGRILVRDDRKVVYNPRYTLGPSTADE